MVKGDLTGHTVETPREATQAENSKDSIQRTVDLVDFGPSLWDRAVLVLRDMAGWTPCAMTLSIRCCEATWTSDHRACEQSLAAELRNRVLTGTRSAELAFEACPVAR